MSVRTCECERGEAGECVCVYVREAAVVVEPLLEHLRLREGRGRERGARAEHAADDARADPATHGALGAAHLHADTHSQYTKHISTGNLVEHSNFYTNIFEHNIALINPNHKVCNPQQYNSSISVLSLNYQYYYFFNYQSASNNTFERINSYIQSYGFIHQ